jgi:hypothetical protein
MIAPELQVQIKVPLKHPRLNKKISEIMEMGFGSEESLVALDISEGNVQNAVTILLERPELVKDHSRCKTLPDTINNVTSKTKLGSLKSKSLLNVDEYLHKAGKVTNPRNVTTPPSSLSLKFTKLFGNNDQGKVTSGLDQQPTDNADGLLSDTFTIYSGYQVRTMTNIRLEVKSQASYFQSNLDPVQELAIRAQTCISLYSQNLSGIIVLLHPNEYQNYCTTAASNRGVIHLNL